MVTIAVVGVGNWGKNHVRTFAGLQEVQLKYVFDTEKKRLSPILKQFPEIKAPADYNQILKDPDVQGIVIATPAITHYALAKEALVAGKDVFVEKPMTLRAAEGEELVDLAAVQGRVLMVGHLLLFHPAVRKLKEIIASGELGTLYYIYAQRLNLGIIRTDENVLWSLAPHDISVICFLLDMFPANVVKHGATYLQPNLDDVAFLHLSFQGNLFANIHVSWLDPHKVRKITIVGSKKMVVFDDMEVSEKIKIFDRGASPVEYRNYGESIGLRFGDITIPHVASAEPLRLEAEHFISCIKTRQEPLTNGKSGVEVVRVLEMAEEESKSLRV